MGYLVMGVCFVGVVFIEEFCYFVVVLDCYVWSVRIVLLIWVWIIVDFVWLFEFCWFLNFWYWVVCWVDFGRFGN